MKNTSKRLLALLLTALMVSPMTACSEQTQTETDAPETSAQTTPAAEAEETETEPAETEETREPSGAPDTNWDGREWIAYGAKHNTYPQYSNMEIDADEITGETLNDAVFNRNAALEARYNIVISQDVSTEDVHATLPALVLSGDAKYHLSFVETGSVGRLALNGNFLEMTSLPYIDYTKDWWNLHVNEQISIANKLYFTSSDFSMMDKNRISVMFYNKGLLTDLQLPDPVDMVREGTWTVDVMKEWVETAGQDVDGDGELDDTDRFGLGMDSYNAFLTFVVGAGGLSIEKAEGDIPQIVENSEPLIDAVNAVFDLTCTTQNSYFCNDFNGKVSYSIWSVLANSFRAGNTLFASGFTHTLRGFSDSEIDYNVIPYPKLNEAQEKYYNLAEYQTMLFAIPTTCPDLDFAAFVLEALSYESTNTTLYTYYDINCKRKYTYDETGAEMLDLIFSSAVYDLNVIYNWAGINDVLTSTIPQSRNNTFSSAFASRKKGAKKSIEKTVKDYTTEETAE